MLIHLILNQVMEVSFLEPYALFPVEKEQLKNAQSPDYEYRFDLYHLPENDSMNPVADVFNRYKDVSKKRVQLEHL